MPASATIPSHAACWAVAALVASLCAPPADASELRVEKTGVTVSSLKPEDFPTPPGAPLSPLRLEASSRWAGATRGTATAKEQEGCRFRASITTQGRSGNLSQIKLSAEPIQEPPTRRYRWRLVGRNVLCKHRIYLGRGPSLTVVQPTYKDARTGYYDSPLNAEPPRFSQMIVWARRPAKR